MTPNTDPLRHLHRLVPLDLAGDPTGAAPSAAQPIEDAALVSDVNPYGTRRVAALLKRIAGGAVEDELQAERDRAAALKAAPRQSAPVVRTLVACECGCTVTFWAAPGQRYLNSKHGSRDRLRRHRERHPERKDAEQNEARRRARRLAATSLAFGAAS